MNIQFDGKTAIVTGAAHGFGRAIALSFASRGASVWACDLLSDELTETRALCLDAGGACRVETVDVRDRGAVFSFVEDVLTEDGAVQILVNNAGGVLGQVGRPLEEISEGGLGQHLRGQRTRRFLLFASGGAQYEEAAIRPHH